MKLTKKKEEKIAVMKKGGLILGKIMEEAVAFCKTGITTRDLENYIRTRFSHYGVAPSFTTVRNYQDYSCICVNDIIVHGVPNSYMLKHEDIVGVDIGVYHRGFHTDMSWSALVLDEKKAESSELTKKKAFLNTGAETLLKAIDSCRAGNHIGDISLAIQSNIEKAGYRVVRQLVGHAVGKNLHEYPQIPGVLARDIEKTEEITAGMTLAIEVIYAMGEEDMIYKNQDGWSIGTRDGSLSGLYEATVAVYQNRTEIITPIDRLLKRRLSGII